MADKIDPWGVKSVAKLPAEIDPWGSPDQPTSPIPQSVAGLPQGQAPPGLPGAPPVNMKPSPVGQIFGDPGTYAGVPAKHIANMVKGIGGLAAPAQNGGEVAASALGGPAALPAYRALIQPSIQPLKDTANYAKQGQWGNARKSAINAVPIAGPWGQAVENEAQTSGGVPAALGMATDIAVPEIGSAFAPAAGAALGNNMKGTGSWLMDTTIGAGKKEFKRGAQPGASYLEAGGTPAITMKSLAGKAADLKSGVGQQLSAAYKNADASGTLIPSDTVRAALKPAIQDAIDTTMGEGGSLDPSQYLTHAESFGPMLQRGDLNGGLQPSDVFRAKKNVADNTTWTDPMNTGLKSVRQASVGGLGDVLSNAVPEVAPLNKQYQGLYNFASKAKDKAATAANPVSIGMRRIPEAVAGGFMGHAMSSDPIMAGALATIPTLADTVPVKTTAAYGLYKGGQAANKTGEALGNLQGSAYLFPPKKKK